MSDPASDKAGEAQGELRGVLPAGTTLRGYELKAILGQGAFGITYRARDTTLDRDVAIKEYLPTTLALREGRTTVMPRSPEHAEQFAWGRERFLEEARILARLDLTTAIVRVYDFLEANGTAYMVMALVEGETLAKRLLREQRLTPEAIERLLYPLLDGLEELHDASFLHRDIKPANVMVDGRGRPTLIDFGASRAAMAERSTTLTAIFTPGYAAIEQFTSTNLGPWTDIYGLAATFYHAITGRIPPSAIERMVNDTWEALTDLQPPGFPPALLAGIDAALAVRGEDRPQSIAEWRHMLRSGERLSSQEPTRVAQKPRGMARAGRRSGQAGITVGRPALWGAAAAAILLLAGGGYLAFHAAAPPAGGVTTLALSTEQLEHVLAERRKADALAAEKRQLVDEARRKAEVEAEAKRQTEAELEQARQARQKAEDDLAKLKADIAAQRQAETGQRESTEAVLRRAAEEAAQRKAEDEAEGLRLAEEEAKKKVTADAEAKQQADEALAKAEAERQQADQAARLKTEAEATAMRQASEDTQRKALQAEARRLAEEAQAKAKAEREKADAEAKAKAEADKAATAAAKLIDEAQAAENGLRLDRADRQRLQVALTALGFDTGGTDGMLGPRSRATIANWQQKAGVPATGFLTAAQRNQILRSAAPAVARWEEEQKKIEEEKAKADAAKLATAATSAAPSPAQSSTSTAGQQATNTYDGAYSAPDIMRGSKSGATTRASASLQVTNGRGSGTITSPGCSPSHFSVSISPTGLVSGEGYLSCVLAFQSGRSISGPLKIEGSAKGRNLVLSFRTEFGSVEVTLSPGGPAPFSPSPPSPDGLWRGTYACTPIGSVSAASEFTIDLNLKLTNGISSGGGVLESRLNGRTINIDVSVNPPDVTVTRTYLTSSGNSPPQRGSFQGQYDGNSIRAKGRIVVGGGWSAAVGGGGGFPFDCIVMLTRVP